MAAPSPRPRAAAPAASGASPSIRGGGGRHRRVNLAPRRATSVDRVMAEGLRSRRPAAVAARGCRERCCTHDRSPTHSPSDLRRPPPSCRTCRSPPRRARDGHRLSRPQRRREVDDPQDAHRPDPPDAGPVGPGGLAHDQHRPGGRSAGSSTPRRIRLPRGREVLAFSAQDGRRRGADPRVRTWSAWTAPRPERGS